VRLCYIIATAHLPKGEEAMRKTLIALSALSLLGSTGAYAATQCRDAHGKFTKCPQKAAPKAKQCRDAKGHYTKCK